MLAQKARRLTRISKGESESPDSHPPDSPGGKDAHDCELERYRRLSNWLSRRIRKLEKSELTKNEDKGSNDPGEDLIKTQLAEVEVCEKILRVSQQQRLAVFGRLKGFFHSTYDTVTRYDFRLVLTETKYRVETLVCEKTGRRYRASLSEIGPANSQITWRSLQQVMLLAVEYAIPLERISKMLGRFSGVQIFRLLECLARRLLPIYLYLAERLSEARYLSCDDSSTRVLRAEAALALGGYGNESKLPDLVSKTAEALGRGFRLKKSEKLKKRFNVSVLHGRADAQDPLSHIVFYRSHNGSSGNLLSSILSMRRGKNKDPVTIQSDLSTQNLPNPQIMEKFILDLVGCGSHARRPFWRYRFDDENLCGRLLSYFRLIFYVEEKIKAKGLKGREVTTLRVDKSLPIWNKIHDLCQDILDGNTANRWPRNSQIAGGANYVVKNFKALTAYIHDPNLSSTNNLSERLLRPEKMLLVSCKFRLTENGRVVFDILRTVLMTCRAIGANLSEYLSWIGSADLKEIEICPENFTPEAFMKRKLNSGEEGIAA